MKVASILLFAASAHAAALNLQVRQTAPTPATPVPATPAVSTPKPLNTNNASPNISGAISAFGSLLSSFSDALGAVGTSVFGSSNPINSLGELLKGNTGPPSAPKTGTAPAGAMNPAIIAAFVPEVKMFDKTSMTPKIRRDATRVKIRYGPLDLVGKDMKKPFTESFSQDPKGQARVSLIKANQLWCRDCSVLGGIVSMSYEDGRPAVPDNGVYIHHLLTYDMSKQMPNPMAICDVADDKDIGQINKMMGSELPMAPFFGRGEDNGLIDEIYTSVDGKYNSGFHVGKEDMFTVQTDLVNYNKDSVKVYITFEVEYVEGIQGKDAASHLLSVVGCKPTVPKVNMTGRAETNSLRFPVLHDSTILNAKGHLHSGGEKMVLKVNDKVVCESYPEYNKDGVIVNMSLCDAVPLKLLKGDYLGITSVYDVPKYPLRHGTDGHSHAQNILGSPDIMGMWAITFALDEKK